MRTHPVIPSSAAVLLLVVTGCATPTAKLTRADATALALAKVPGGTVKDGELEKEHGRLIWSLDIATPGTANITEVQVDAQTGEIVSTEIETPAQQKKESEADRK